MYASRGGARAGIVVHTPGTFGPGRRQPRSECPMSRSLPRFTNGTRAARQRVLYFDVALAEIAAINLPIP